jgi:predicted O-methyltransferase YrrM
MVEQVKRQKPPVILEMGTGFSTLVLRDLAPQVGTVVFSAEHDPTWLGFVRGLVSTRPQAIQTHFYTIPQVKARARRKKSRFAVVFVDHGPTWEARLEDLAWCKSVLRPGGELWLDDWYPEGTKRNRLYTQHARGRLTKLGAKMHVPSQSRRQGDRKSLCVARFS